MKNIRNGILFFITLLACTDTVRGQAIVIEKLSPDAFHHKLQQTPDAQVVDVRTPEEFKKNHIKGALNININADAFEAQVAALDKSKPVMVYCLSGGRSAKAVAYMRRQGFSTVYELQGGMMQWTAADRPTETSGRKAAGMSVEEFNKKVNSGKLVLVDFYAKWCAPCKKMAPELAALASQYASQLTLLKINADEHAVLVDALSVDALPTLLLFREGKQVWLKTGFTEKSEVEKNIKANF